MRSKPTPIDEKRHTTGGLAIWRGRIYSQLFVRYLASVPARRFSIGLQLLSSSFVTLFISGYGHYKIPAQQQALSVSSHLINDIPNLNHD
jgi:hypothetical protein